MQRKPLVSVIMPAYNVKQYVRSALESILHQTYRNFEFIIIDDKSNDGTFEILKSYRKNDKRIVLSRNRRNIGVSKSLNRALQLTRGEYIIRMDADDWSYPERFELQIKLMQNNPGVVVSGSFIEVCDSKLKIKYLRKYGVDDKEIRKHLFRYSPFAHPATIWQAEVIKKERYNEAINASQDYELYFRVGRFGKFMNLNKPLLKLRMHGRSVSTTMSDLQIKNTILIRLNAVLMLGYNMSNFDKLYNFLQEISIHVIPVRFRFFIFNFLRRFNFY